MKQEIKNEFKFKINIFIKIERGWLYPELNIKIKIKNWKKGGKIFCLKNKYILKEIIDKWNYIFYKLVDCPRISKRFDCWKFRF